MTVIEISLLILILISCTYVTITDIRNSVIQNKVLLASAFIGLILNSVYYGYFCRDLILGYLINFAVMSAISIVFYAMHFWAAGDSKMLILIMFLLPAGIYYSGNNVSATVGIVIIIFSLAFIFTVIESIVVGILHKNLFDLSSIHIDIKSMIAQYIKCSCVITIINIVLFLIVPEFQTANKSLLMICNMVVVFAIYNVKILDKLISLIVLVILTASMFIFVNGLNFEININFSVYIFTALVLFLRLISEKYNYIEIPTSEVKKGMVISYSTILGFLPSNVKGLPKSTTEDVRSRLSQDEADSIARWEKTKYGKSHITIVRKIPFAIFIFIGTVIFILLRMFVL